jgi:hypothetical protein
MYAAGHISAVEKQVKNKTRAGTRKVRSQRGNWNLYKGIYKKGERQEESGEKLKGSYKRKDKEKRWI